MGTEQRRAILPQGAWIGASRAEAALGSSSGAQSGACVQKTVTT